MVSSSIEILGLLLRPEVYTKSGSDFDDELSIVQVTGDPRTSGSAVAGNIISDDQVVIINFD